jgi:hypothetical protein
MNRTVTTLRWTARSFSVLILAFWGFFIVAHLLGDAGRPSRPLVVRDYALITAMLAWLAGLALAWRHELIGAVTALAAIAVAACLNPWAVAGLGVLPLAAALLFLLTWWLGRMPSRRPAA